MIERLESSGGKHLVVVRYNASHSFHREWVYNRADVDAAPVVWARSMGEGDSTLVRYYRDRKIWTLYVDDDPEVYELIPHESRGG